MRAIVDGLQLAWTLGIRRIQVHSDSMAAISILAKDSELGHQHIYREANNAADYLANLGHSLSYGLHFFDSPDRCLSHWLHYDIIGVSLPRLVRISNNN
ncbi:Putative ribonuclease H protein At1g65750 [Linum grandiflorum]